MKSHATLCFYEQRQELREGSLKQSGFVAFITSAPEYGHALLLGFAREHLRIFSDANSTRVLRNLLFLPAVLSGLLGKFGGSPGSKAISPG